MLKILTPEDAHILSEIIVSPVQVALATNGVVDDFSYHEILPMNYLKYLTLPASHPQACADPEGGKGVGIPWKITSSVGFFRN